jgi:hypothetical protein
MLAWLVDADNDHIPFQEDVIEPLAGIGWKDLPRLHVVVSLKLYIM